MIDRWKRGLAATAFMAVTTIAAFLAVGLPMFVLGEALNYKLLQSLSLIAPLAFFIALPWIVTNVDVSRAIRQVLDDR